MLFLRSHIKQLVVVKYPKSDYSGSTTYYLPPTKQGERSEASGLEARDRRALKGAARKGITA